MAQQVETFVVKLGSQSLIPETHVVEGGNQVHTLFFDFHSMLCHTMLTHTHTLSILSFHIPDIPGKIIPALTTALVTVTNLTG